MVGLSLGCHLQISVAESEKAAIEKDEIRHGYGLARDLETGWPPH
jgi:hypothetical protein